MENKDLDICSVILVDVEKVDRVKKIIPEMNIVTAMADTFKALCDPTRLKIVIALSEEELCVCDLSNLIQSSQSLISHQLRVLRNLKLVKYRRQGKMVYYSLDDLHIKKLIEEIGEHEREQRK